MSEEMNEHTPLPCPCGAPAGLACDKNDCMSPTRYAHMAAASDPGTDFSHPTLLARIRELEAERDAANARAGEMEQKLTERTEQLRELYKLFERHEMPHNFRLEIERAIRALKEAGK
jgi:hypothetical protein